MSGHSKWANIQHRKGRQDAKRSNIWTKLIREIIVAARLGGGDADSNPRLRLALLKARGANVPKDTVNNAILKGTGKLEGVSYEEIRYEGYGVGGAALIIDCTTDNKTRTVADVRHVLSKNGGNLGTDGSVSFMFKHCGYFLFAPGLTPLKSSALRRPLKKSMLLLRLKVGNPKLLKSPGRATQKLFSPENRAKKCRNFWMLSKISMTFSKFSQQLLLNNF